MKHSQTRYSFSTHLADFPQKPESYIVLKENAAATEEEIREYVKTKVAAYKQLREVEFRKELPTSAIGKALKETLKEEETPRKWDERA